MNLPDIPRLYTALAEWAGCMVYILLLPKRCKTWRLALLAAGALAAQGALQLLAGEMPLVLWMTGMAANLGFMFLFVWGACDISARDALYCTVRAFTVAEFTASFEWQLRCYFLTAAPRAAWDFAGLAFIYAGVYLGVYAMERHSFSTDRRPAVNRKDLFSGVTIALTVFLVSNLSFYSTNTPFSGVNQVEIFYIRTLVDFCGMVLLYTQQEQRRLTQAKYELDAIHNILHRQYDQYRQSKESIDLINRKYHDLKHQIAVIRAEQDPGKKQAYLDEMESGIRMVEAQNKTGSSVLDTVLTGKSMVCARENITMTVVADGTLLEFMDAMDLCTIFGNALDNAIESVEKLTDPDKRLIRVAVFRQNDFVLIRVENYYENALTFEGGLPATTKKHKSYHGYGIKSMQFTAEKYGGSVTVTPKDGWFTLCVLLPRPQNATEKE